MPTYEKNELSLAAAITAPPTTTINILSTTATMASEKSFSNQLNATETLSSYNIFCHFYYTQLTTFYLNSAICTQHSSHNTIECPLYSQFCMTSYNTINFKTFIFKLFLTLLFITNIFYELNSFQHPQFTPTNMTKQFKHSFDKALHMHDSSPPHT